MDKPLEGEEGVDGPPWRRRLANLSAQFSSAKAGAAERAGSLTSAIGRLATGQVQSGTCSSMRTAQCAELHFTCMLFGYADACTIPAAHVCCPADTSPRLHTESPDNRAVTLQTAPFVVHTDVAKALRDRRAVVALESTILCHGMPYPQNLQTAQEVEAVVREGRLCSSGGARAHFLPHACSIIWFVQELTTLPELKDRTRQRRIAL